ncbi:MAG: GumC family protein [Microcoleus sp.]
MTENKIDSIAETEAGYGELFAVLIRRRFWLLSILCIITAAATVKALKEKPTYQSSMQILVEANYQGKKNSKADSQFAQFADPSVEVDNATQLKLMQGSQLIKKAVDLLRPQYPEIDVDEIKESLTVSQVADEKAQTQTKIFEVTYTANHPTQTQKVLQVMQRVYLEYNREQQKLRLTKGLTFIDEQLPKARKNVARVEATLEEFRKSQNLIEPESQAKAMTEAINSIQQERRTIQTNKRDFQAQNNSLQQQLASSPQEALTAARLSQSSRYQALLNEIQKTDLAIAQQRIRFTDRNPYVQKLLSERNKQLSLLEAERQRISVGGSAELPDGGENLLQGRQLGETDLIIANKLLEIQTNLKGLTARDAALAKKEEQLRVELDRFPNLLAKYARLQTEVQLKRETFQQLEKARQDLSLEIARGGFDWQVVEVPQPGVQGASKKQQNIMLGVVVGLFLGVAAAFARDMLDDSVHSPKELKKLVPLPLLGVTPQLPIKQKKSIARLLFGKRKGFVDWATEPIVKLPFGKPEGMGICTIEVIHSPPAWECFDLIYQNIQLQNAGANFSPLTIASASNGEGKSTIALGLAVSAARLHQRVLLIDADFRQPTLHELLDLPNEYGLSTMLESSVTVSICGEISTSDDIYIDILTSGPIPKDPVNLLSSPQMQKLMAGFERTYDLVLLNAPPVLGVVDALLLASYCRGVVLVTRLNRVTKTALTETTAMLNKIKTIGAIANGGMSFKKGKKPF